MTSAEATKILGMMVQGKATGMSWEQIARHNKLPNGKAAKKLAKQAARISQNVLLAQKLDLN